MHISQIALKLPPDISQAFTCIIVIRAKYFLRKHCYAARASCRYSVSATLLMCATSAAQIAGKSASR